MSACAAWSSVEQQNSPHQLLADLASWQASEGTEETATALAVVQSQIRSMCDRPNVNMDGLVLQRLTLWGSYLWPGGARGQAACRSWSRCRPTDRHSLPRPLWIIYQEVPIADAVNHTGKLLIRKKTKSQQQTVGVRKWGRGIGENVTNCVVTILCRIWTL